VSKKYQIFISSTYQDLKEQRDNVIKGILEMGHIPVGMEMFSAGDEAQWKLIQRTIDECDYYVAIIANRYGSLDGDISFTEKEYDYALRKGIPVISFIIDDSAPWPSNYCDKDSKMLKKLKAFKEKVQSKIVKYWSNTEDLYAKAAISLMKAFNIVPRTGWIKADKASSEESNEEILKLRKKIDLLNEEICEYKKRLLEQSSQYAQGTEEITISGLVDIVDAKNQRDMIVKNHKESITLNWQTILELALPAIKSLPSEVKFKNYLGNLIKNNSTSLNNKKYIKAVLKNARISSDSYDQIKVQLLALSFAVLKKEEEETRCFWKITKTGSKKMYELKARPSSKSAEQSRRRGK